MPIRKPVSFRALLLLLALGPLVVASGIVAGMSFEGSRRALHTLTRQQGATLLTAVAHEIQRLLEPSSRLLNELTILARRNLLPLDDGDRFGALLAERLRQERQLAWLSYSDAATGRFVGAWRHTNNTIIVNQSDPGVDGGRPRESILRPDGATEPFPRGVPDGYDPRTKPWFQKAAASRDLVWSPPYEFNEGRRGITASRALRRADGVVQGVFTADFFLDDIAAFLRELARDQKGRAFVLSLEGDVLASPNAPGDEDLVRVLRRFAEADAERRLRVRAGEPVMDRVTVEGHGFVVGVAAVDVEGGLRCFAALVARESDIYASAFRTLGRVLGITGLAVALAVAAGWIAASRLATPLRTLSDGLERIGRFDLSHTPHPESDVREIQTVGDAAARMAMSLRSFSRYVPVEIVRDLVASGREAALGGETREVTIFFSDIVGFTAMSENQPPEAVVRALGVYLDGVTRQIAHTGGTIDKFIGDGVVAFFNAPHDLPGHPARACAAAIAVNAWIASTAGQPPPALDVSGFRTRIGLHTGEVLVGNIGTPERFSYTMIGDAANLASRLEALNKLYGTSRIASNHVRQAAGEAFAWRMLDCVAVAGRAGNVVVHELLGWRESIPADVLKAIADYEQALALYGQGRFAEAALAFQALAARDPAARAMAARSTELARNPPVRWTGVFAHETKG